MSEESGPAGRPRRRAPEARCRAAEPAASAAAPAAVPGGGAEAGGLRVEVAGSGGDTAVVTVAGEIDLRTAGVLRDRLVAAHAAGPRRLVADFSAVPFCDAAGLGALVAARNRIAADGGEIVLAGVRPAQLRLLRITGLHRLFAIDGDLDGAHAVHRPGPPPGPRPAGDVPVSASGNGPATPPERLQIPCRAAVRGSRKEPESG